ncbi:inovirus Gp2 family protein [Yersinia enterocolitica]|nr:inovirus Gp2 family protein [Yersinia enterocolitica]ELI9227394.1 inovirus Gp2 family protein [Yersinia enterocolitica]
MPMSHGCLYETPTFCKYNKSRVRTMTDKQPNKTYPINLATHNYLYLARFGSTVRNALITHPRLLVIRVDLRFPDNYDVEGNKAMKAFMAAITSRLEARYKRKKKENPGKQVHYSELHYIWVRENNQCGKKIHYHTLLMFNMDVFNSLGNYWKEGNLADLIINAWLSTLKLEGKEYRGLVYFCKSPCYRLNRANLEATDDYKKLMERTEYMAKHRTKIYSNRIRSAGSSIYDEQEQENKLTRQTARKNHKDVKREVLKGIQHNKQTGYH